MRLYQSVNELLSETQRDIFKGPKVSSTRVQQRTNQDLKGREILGYSYAIEEGGIPTDAQDVTRLGAEFFPFWEKHKYMMAEWLEAELRARLFPESHLAKLNETKHPALLSTLEGNWPAYTYTERLLGMKDSILTALEENTDSRRAFWPIYRLEDAVRASAPTRIPCSLGYQFLIRQTRGGPRLILYYLSRSVDFDTFFLSDLWLAFKVQEYVGDLLNQQAGQFFHTIISLHSFAVEGVEIY